jgi:hypothetical protein
MSNFVLVNRRLNTPGVVVARADDLKNIELFFHADDAGNASNANETVAVRVTQEATGLGITIPVHCTVRFTLSPGDALWASSSHDVTCWQLWSTTAL